MNNNDDGQEVKVWRQLQSFDDGSLEIVPWGEETLADKPSFVSMVDYNRLAAVLREFRAAAFKVMEDMSSTMGRDKNTIDELREEVKQWEQSTDRQTALILRLQETAALQTRMIEKLKEQRNNQIFGGSRTRNMIIQTLDQQIVDLETSKEVK